MRVILAACLAAALATTGTCAAAAPRAVHDALGRIAAEADTDALAARFEALWGLDAEVPVVLHAPDAGAWWQPPGRGAPERFALRDDQPVANTCLDADAEPRVLLMLPLPESPEALAALVWHERWHCVQSRLGLAGREADNAHLATEAGRTWLRLELRALARALAADDEHAARRAAGEALAFRARRSKAGELGTGELREEARVERNEGLAEYTGRKVAAANPVPSMLEALRAADGADSYLRSAAYATGPAYGLLLDRWAPGWRRQRGEALDLSVALAEALGAGGPPIDAGSAGAAYGLAAVRAEESRRAAEARKKHAAYLARFVTGDVLELPLRTPSVSFDPRTLFALGEHGTVYAPITVRDAWGELVAGDGALMASDWSRIGIGAGGVAGEGASWRGPGWTLTLAEGWMLDRTPDGHWTLRAPEHQ